MTEALEVVGLVSLAIAGFCVSVACGFAVLGAGCLWVAWSRARKLRAVK